MSSELAIEVRDLSKAYQIYATPTDRLKQAVMPRVRRSLRPAAGAVGLTLAERNYFQQFWALKSLSFEVKQGETLAIIGQNGSGKSTLLKLICGTLAPSTGEIVTRGRVGALLELGSGFNPEFTGRENVMLNASVLGLSAEETLERLDDILAFADIGDFIEQPIKTYSSGMAMRLAFAVIAHIDADILVIDEALAVGDVFFQQKCMRWLRQFKETGTVLFCGHDTGSVMTLCQRAIWLAGGEMRMVGEAKEVVEAYGAFIHAKTAGLPDDVVRMRRKPAPAAGSGAVAATSTEMPKPAPKLPEAPKPARPVVFDWLSESASFGSGDAEIVEATLTHADRTPLLWIEGGEMLRLRVKAMARTEIAAPIIGFHIKDRLGQPITGTNTVSAAIDVPPLPADGCVIVEFVFPLPMLATGRYTVTVAMANGTLASHVQLHWIHDAIVLDMHSLSNDGVLLALSLSDSDVTIEQLSK